MPSLALGRLFFPFDLAVGVCFMVATLLVVGNELSDSDEQCLRLPASLMRLPESRFIVQLIGGELHSGSYHLGHDGAVTFATAC